ncbi:MAG: hypothetical protein D6731_17055 [Planctomycetota bacterium]|nr:MAG: hypothetical protein D6731_17055 [Planctomycetota bacterium]
MHLRRRFSRFLLPPLLGLLVCPALAQDAAPPSSEEIQRRLAALEASALDEATKQSAADLYRRALEQLALARELEEKAAEFERVAREAPDRLAKIREELSRPPQDPVLDEPPGAPLSQLEQLKAGVEAQLKEAREQEVQLRLETTRRTERRSALSSLLAKRREELRQHEEALQAAASTEEPPAVREARQAFLLARRAALRAEVRAGEVELASYEARAELLPARRDLAQRRVQELERLLAAWQRRVEERRRAEAEAAAREAERLRREAALKTPVLAALAAENQALAERRTGAGSLTELLEASARFAESTRRDLAELRERFRAIRRRELAAGLTDALGKSLRRFYEELPAQGDLAKALRLTEDRLAKAELDVIQLEEQRERAGDIDRNLQELLAELPAEGRPAVEPVARELLEQRRDLLDKLIAETHRLIGVLLELELSQRELGAAAEEFRRYAERRILWVRSVEENALPSPARLAAVGRELLAELRAQIAEGKTLAQLRGSPLDAMAGLGFLLLVVGGALWARRSLAELRPPPSFGQTLLKLLAIPLRAGPLPALFLASGGLLARPEEQPPLLAALGHGLQEAGWTLWALLCVWRAFRRRGLASDLHWSMHGARQVRRHLLWFVPVKVLATCVVVSLDRQPNALWSDVLGRLVFGLDQLALAALLFALLRADGGLLAGYRGRTPQGWVARLRVFWFPLALLLPAGLLLLAFAGYYYTALRLESCLEASLAWIAAAAVLHGLLLRWLLLARRRLAAQASGAESGSPRPDAAPDDAAAPDTGAAGPERLDGSDPTVGGGGASVSGEAATEPSRAGSGEETRAEAPPPDDGASTPHGSGFAADAASGPGASVEGEPASADKAAASPGVPLASPAGDADADADAGGDDELSSDDAALDLAAVRSQSLQLFRFLVAVFVVSGLLAIWAEVLPALGQLERVQLWPRFAVVDLQEAEAFTVLERAGAVSEGPPAGTPAPAPAPAAPSPQPVSPNAAPSAEGGETAPAPLVPRVLTLADVGLAFLALLLTLALVRNLPGVLEIVLFERLPMDAGGRYAAIAVTRYVLVLGGASYALGRLGITWSSVQWLAAALTFGLAFGLQEIFANFVSGLILLAERPIRIGDVVTVGAVNGKVTRIRIRATTIQQWNGKELVIPNKNFVTGDVINWTLSESRIRIEMPVGLAYGSATALAKEILLEVARGHPDVLAEPEPSAFFLGFGASTLDFELRVWVPDPSFIPEVREDILQGIQRRFAAAGLEIAFPQQDVHLRSGSLALRLEGTQGRIAVGDAPEALEGSGRAEAED